MLTQFLRYAAAGTAGTGVHYCLLLILVYAQSPPVVATTLGAITGAIVNYHLCQRWVFINDNNSRGKPTHRFFAIAAVNTLINAAIVIFVAPIFGLWIAQLSATLICLLNGYVVNKHWTFQHRLVVFA